MQTEQQKEIASILDRHGFDFIDAFEVEQWHTDGDDIQDELQSRINEQEIIYYSNAIEYLAANDASLQECMELASDCGYEAKNLNSEILATLLYQQKLSENLGALVSDIEAFDFAAPVEEAEEA